MKEDKDVGCGYGIFKVKDKDNEAFCRVHDYGYERGSLSQETMSKDDFDNATIERFSDYNESKGRFGGAFRLRYIYRPIIWGFTKVFKLWEGKK
mgnify:CR=1 FL=1